MDIILLRHGETEDNIKKIFGRSDTKLSSRGKLEVARLKEEINEIGNIKIYNSPLDRIYETMEILEIVGEEVDLLKEYNFGIFTGYNYKEILELYPEETQAWTNNPLEYNIPKGDSLEEKYKLLSNFLDSLVKKDEDVLIVAHAGIIQLAMCWVFDNLKFFYKFKVDTASLSKININGDFKYIDYLNFKI